MIKDKANLENTFKELIKWFINVHQLSVPTVNAIEQSLENTLAWFQNEIANPYLKMRRRNRGGRREAT